MYASHFREQRDLSSYCLSGKDNSRTSIVINIGEPEGRLVEYKEKADYRDGNGAGVRER